MSKILAIDAGGTKTAYAIVDKNGKILSKVEKVSTPKSKEGIERLFREVIKKYEEEVSLVAFATAGAINLENTGVEGSTPNMPKGYTDVQFPLLSKKPVFVENDANAAAWAEYVIGAAKGESNNITITLGTGIGGGFIVNGVLLRGKNGRGGEVGSMKIAGRGRICTCGRKDCFESYASGTGLKFTAEETAINSESFKISIYKQKNPKDITTQDIILGLKEEDLYSKEVFNIWKQDLVTGLINITNIFNPGVIVISGGMGQFVDIVEVEQAINTEIVVSNAKVRHAIAGNYSGLIGAALLAAKKFLL